MRKPKQFHFYQQKKKTTKEEEGCRQEENSDIYAVGLQKWTPSLSICLVKMQIRNYKQSLGGVGGVGEFCSDWLQTFLMRLMESIDLPQRVFQSESPA